MKTNAFPVVLALPLLCLGTSVPLWPQPQSVAAGHDVVWLDVALTATLKYGSASEPVEWHTLGKFQQFYKRSSQQLKRGMTVLQSRLGLPKSWRMTQDEYTEAMSELRILNLAVEELLTSLSSTNFVPWKFHRRHANFEPDPAGRQRILSRLYLLQQSCPPSDFSPDSFFSADESYEVKVDHDEAIIKSNSTVGILRGLASFRQIFFAHSSGQGVYTPYTPLHVVDAPRWAHRGLSLDIARNPFSIDDILRTIDAMASTKMNKLHLHATDSQSWPLEIPTLPELAAKGAYHPDQVLTARQLQEIQHYGTRRGVEVYIEIDMPGHTASVAHAFPKLIAAYNQLDWSTFAAEPLSGQLKLQSAKVTEFLDQLFDDLLPRMKSQASLYHLGGDEVNENVHLLDETVKSREKEVLQPLVQQLMSQVFRKAVEHDLRPVLWEEMILDWELSFSADADDDMHKRPLIQVWRSNENIEKVLKKGYPIIFGDSKHWYLDCGFGQFLDPYPSGWSPPGVPFNSSGGMPSRLNPPYLDYCAPYHNWRAIYMFNPLQNISKTLQAGIEGGEVLMWSEQTDGVDLDVKLWPRAAAAAEVLWAGPRQQPMMADATWRLGHWRERLVQDRHTAASPVQMTWCLMEGGCEY